MPLAFRLCLYLFFYGFWFRDHPGSDSVAMWVVSCGVRLDVCMSTRELVNRLRYHHVILMGARYRQKLGRAADRYTAIR